MISRLTTLLCLALLAGCGRFDDLPEEPALMHEAAVAPTPVWNLSLPGGLCPTHVVAIDRNDFILAGQLFDDSLVLDGKRFVSHGRGDLLLSRMDANGHIRWAKQLGVGGNLTSIASNGKEFVMSGFFDLGVGALPEHAIIAKLDAAGEIVWSKPITNPPVRRISIDDAGNVAALIDVQYADVVKFSADGQQLWTHQDFPGVQTRDIVLTRGGDLITVGQRKGRRRTTDVGYDYEATIARDDPEGHARWARQYGARDEKHFALRVTVDDAGNLFVEQAAGEWISDWVQKYDADGVQCWRDSVSFEGPAKMVPDGAGGVVFWADVRRIGPSLRWLDADGQLVWSRTLPRSSGEISSLARTPSGALLIAGQSHGRFRLDGDDVPASSKPLTTFVAAFRLGPGAGP
jgi:outer membrane protein assembly factor BamB